MDLDLAVAHLLSYRQGYRSINDYDLRHDFCFGLIHAFCRNAIQYWARSGYAGLADKLTKKAVFSPGILEKGGLSSAGRVLSAENGNPIVKSLNSNGNLLYWVIDVVSPDLVGVLSWQRKVVVASSVRCILVLQTNELLRWN